jgi:hypothetical protein
MSRLAPQAASAVTIISQAKWIGSPPPLAAMPATIVPSRMARKVPPSTSALPVVNSARLRWSGRIPYLMGPNSDAMVPNRNTAKNKRINESKAKPATAIAATAISASLSRCAITALS